MTYPARPKPVPVPATFATIGDGVVGQVVTRQLLPPHLDRSAHQGRGASCPCVPLWDQLLTIDSWPVVPRGTREACTQEEHALEPLRVAAWPRAPQALRDAARLGRVQLTITMCAFCGAIEVRDTSFHVLAGMRSGTAAPARRSDVLGWYAGKRPAGRIYV